MTTTVEECLEALRAAAEELGESPTKAEYEALGRTPAPATIIRQVGGWNEAKRRAGLETNQSRGSRVAPKPDHVELPDGMEWEEMTIDQRWHYRNVDWNTERTLKRRARLRSWVSDHKRDQGCRDCGVGDPAVLDFHHRDPDEKEMSVGRMVTFGYGKDALLEEMAKCDVLCANCHRKVHHTIPEDGSKRWVYELKRGADGCGRCDEETPACLDFHHVRGEKRASIARLLADGEPRSTIRDEIDKCELLCANCHRASHVGSASDSGSYDNHK